MRVGDSNIFGPLALQHEDYDKRGFSLERRASMFAFRAKDRLTTGGQVGHWLGDKESVGDIHGGQLFKTDTRDTPMWRFATPVVATKTSTATQGRPNVPTGGGAPPAGKACGTLAANQFGMAPVYDDSWGPDTRLKALQPSFQKSKDGKKSLLAKPALGTFGISLTANIESKQVDLFLPTDGRLIAVNAGGDPEMGSLVCDLKPDFTVDPDRRARLQSAFWVIKKPLGRDITTLAWNLNDTGCGPDDGGYVIDKPNNGQTFRATVASGATSDTSVGARGNLDPIPLDQNAPNRVVGRLSVAYGGFIDVGSGKCAHNRGKDADGFPELSAHISTRALFRRNDTEDGPLDFTTYEAPNSGGNVTTPVKLGFRGDVWAWTAKSWFLPPPAPVDPWKLRPDPINPQFPPLHPTVPAPTITPTNTGKIIPNVPPQGPGVTSTPGGGGGPGVPSDPGTPSPSGLGSDRVFIDKDGKTWTRDKTPGGMYLPWVLSSDSGGLGRSLSLNAGTFVTPLNFITPTVGVAEQAKAAFAQNYQDGMPNTGLTGDPTSLSNKVAKKVLDSTPFSAIESAFAAQGGTKGSGSAAASTGATGDPWKYTQEPRKGKYRNGTASGGWCFHPPETDLRDVKNWGMVPPNTPVSTVYRISGPGAWWGCGVPELVDGSIKEGWSWGMETSTGNLNFRSHSGISAPSVGVVFVKTSQNIRWYSGQSSYVEIDHAASANRTATFVDLTANVEMFQEGFGDPNAVVTGVRGTLYWDRTGSTLYVNTNNATAWSALSTGGISGGGASPQVAYWSGATTLTGSANLTFDGTTVATVGLATKATSPTSLSANQNDYAIGSGTFFRLTSSGAVTITGLTGGTDGKQIIIRNIGTFTITLSHQSGRSVAANRMTFSSSGDYALPPQGTLAMIYDATDQRWVEL